jgi:PKD repeat protein
VCFFATISIIGAALCLVPENSRADWDYGATLGIGPSTVYPQETFTFDYTLYISGIGSASLEIYHVNVKLDWESAAVDVCPGTVVMAVPSSHTFHRTVVIPQSATAGSHTQSIDINGKASNDLWSSTVSWIQSLTVASRNPLQLTISGNPSTGSYPLLVAFTSTPTGGTNTEWISGVGWQDLPYTYSWTFGDGGSSSEANPSHTYQTAGSFTVTLVIHDGLSRMTSAAFLVTVTIPPLQLAISRTPASGDYPLEVSFSSSVSGGVPPYSYSWTFGDGGTSAQANPVHTYEKSGTFVVTLVVHDSQSGEITKTTDVTVSTPPGGRGSVDNDTAHAKAVADMNTLITAGVVLGLVIVAALVAVVYLLRKKKGPPQPNQQNLPKEGKGV